VSTAASKPRPRIGGTGTALTRAAKKAEAVRPPVRRVGVQGGQSWFAVMSASRAGAEHVVRQDASGRLHCGCEAGLSRRPCWHLFAVVGWLAEQSSESDVREDEHQPALLVRRQVELV